MIPVEYKNVAKLKLLVIGRFPSSTKYVSSERTGAQTGAEPKADPYVDPVKELVDPKQV